jgi:regulatory protein RepA
VVEIEAFDTTRSAWRLEASLREFPPIAPVNFYFDYPLHPLDTEGVLATYYPEGSGLGNLGLSSRKSTPEMRKKRLDEAFDATANAGIATVKEMADYAGVSVETIRRYLKEYSEEYLLKNGIVLERPPLENSTSK